MSKNGFREGTEVVIECEAIVTRGWQRLKELKQVDLPIIDYPLPEVREMLAQRARQ